MAKILAEDHSLVVREGNLDRNRVPAQILSAAGLSYDTGDGISWQVQDFGTQGLLIVGVPVKNARSMEAFARKPPTPPARAAQPTSAKKAAGKKGKKTQNQQAAVTLPTSAAPLPALSAAAVPLGNFGSQFSAQFAGDDELYDDGPIDDAPQAVAPLPVARPAAAPVPQTAAAPVAKGGTKGGGKKSGAKKGAVAYQVPGQTLGGLGSQFT